jgi:Uncharacterized conserved protein
MKTDKQISVWVAFSILFLISMSSCCKSKTEQTQEACCSIEQTREGCCKSKQECMIDENALMIVASLTIKNEADKAELEKALYQVVDGTRVEDGNISYVLHKDINNPMTYVIFEVWKSQDAINFHNETAHFKSFVEAVGDKAELSVITMKKVY